MAGQASVPSRRGVDPTSVAIVLVFLVVAAILVLAIALLPGVAPPGSGGGSPAASAAGGGAASLAPSPAGSTAASPSSGPASVSPSPSVASTRPGGLVVDAIVEADAEGLPIMESASVHGLRVGSLPTGQPAFVVAGPIVVDDLTWYLLSGLGLPPNTGCEEPSTPADCPGWIGWVPATDGAASLRPSELVCPDQTDYEPFAQQAPLARLVCARGQRIEVTGWWLGPSPYHTCIDSPPGVDWLYCAPGLGGLMALSPNDEWSGWVGTAIDPASGVSPPEAGRWVTVTGHVDDPAAAACRVVPGAPDAELAAWSQVLQCRSTLVVESMVEVAAPTR